MFLSVVCSVQWGLGHALTRIAGLAPMDCCCSTSSPRSENPWKTFLTSRNGAKKQGYVLGERFAAVKRCDHDHVICRRRHSTIIVFRLHCIRASLRPSIAIESWHCVFPNRLHSSRDVYSSSLNQCDSDVLLPNHDSVLKSPH